ncbi:MAG: sensor histidine kinase [Anaerolineales bacterium]|nr:sensor histidine kinase [Anaerolineales bacterium]
MLFTFLIYFFYGLAFFSMGLAVLLESTRAPVLTEARILRPLAFFGLLHGAHEWSEVYLIQASLTGFPNPVWLNWARLCLLAISFMVLLVFAIRSFYALPRQSKRDTRFWTYTMWAYIFGILLVTLLTRQDVPVTSYVFIDLISRYLLGVTAPMLAAFALNRQSAQAFHRGQKKRGVYLIVMELGFTFYAISQLFVNQASLFPASVLNQEIFLAVAGFPIQVVRTLAAIVITVMILLVMKETENERQQELAAVQDERLKALEQQEALQRSLLRHTVSAQEEERARIARELHDETAQMLSALSLEVASLQKVALVDSKTSQIVGRLKELTKQMSQKLYRLIHDLRPAQLDDLGLAPAIRYIIDQDCCPMGIEVEFDIKGNPRRLEPLIETVLFRVAQEALINIVRHARVDEAELDLVYQSKQVVLLVRDYGRGFNPDDDFEAPRGWGLAGMRERVDSVNGRLIIDSAIGRGTTIEVFIPAPEYIPENEES